MVLMILPALEINSTAGGSEPVQKTSPFYCAVYQRT